MRCRYYFCLLPILLQCGPLVKSQNIRWEDGTTPSGSGGDDKLHNVNFEGEGRTSKSEEVDSDPKNHHSSGKYTNEIVSKQYSPQAPYPQPIPPSPYQSQFNNQYPPPPPPSLSSPGSPGSNWEWSSPSSNNAGTGSTTQQRRPSFVQFPGESYTIGSFSSPPSPYNSISSNYGRRNKTYRGSSFSSAVRIDENCHCGVVPVEKDNKKLQRIVGGIISKENSWPWMVSIAYMGQSKPFWFCGGSLISDKFVLTAAHCMKTIRNFGFSNIKLIMGTNNLLDSKAAVYYSIRAIRPHPLYKSGTEDYDIALLELKEKVNFTSKVSPICLRQENGSYVNRTVIVAGWGSLQNGDGPPADLREVDLKVVPEDLCQKEYYYNYRTSITPSMLCAWLPDKDSCQGDSGGPLFLKQSSAPYAYTQIGIVSFGPPQCGTTTIPGVYSRVSSAIRWIKSIAKTGKFCKGSF